MIADQPETQTPSPWMLSSASLPTLDSVSRKVEEAKRVAKRREVKLEDKLYRAR